MKTALIFGATGGIGEATVKQLSSRHCDVVAVGRDRLDFRGATSEQVSSVITATDPDIIVNCTGLLEGEFNEIFDVNVGSNWHIIQHFMRQTQHTKPVTIVLVGSTAYSSGRRNYPLYAASKAALHILVQGCQEALVDTPITLSLLHPARVKTRMSANLPVTSGCLSPDQVAGQIAKMCKESSQIKELRL